MKLELTINVCPTDVKDHELHRQAKLLEHYIYMKRHKIYDVVNPIAQKIASELIYELKTSTEEIKLKGKETLIHLENITGDEQCR